MKTKLLVLLLCGGLWLPASAQSFELSQLLLNIEKLNQLREILDQMYSGYKTLSDGYNKIKAVTSGNFQIHDLFLEGLLLVNPEIKKYYKVAGIIDYQLKLSKEYKEAFALFKSSDIFNATEITDIGNVYAKLVKESLQNLDELLMVITARQVRMNDEERLAAIDRIYTEMEGKLMFLRSFNRQQGQTAILKLKEKSELQTLRNLHGLK